MCRHILLSRDAEIERAHFSPDVGFQCPGEMGRDFFDNLSVKTSLEQLRHGVAIVKEDICKSLPPILLDRFCNRILNEFSPSTHQNSHCRIILEIAMDMEIVGLTTNYQSSIFRFLDLEDAKRLRRLKTLNFSHFSNLEPVRLENFDLTSLREFIFFDSCTDSHLRIIGNNCRKLEVLDIRYSPITDDGLRALGPCTELREINISQCTVYYNAVNHLLLVHKKLKKLGYFGENVFKFDANCEVLLHLDSSVQCPSINYFIVDSRSSSNMDLRPLVTKFPNLSYVVINDSITRDLATLRYLNKLTGLELNLSECSPMSCLGDVNPTWRSLKELLTFVGAKIRTLKLQWFEQYSVSSQDRLDFVFNSCPNIEHLELDHMIKRRRTLVIPPFRKLKKLFFRLPTDIQRCDILSSKSFQFGIMSNLEILSLVEYRVKRALVSILLNNLKFPKLSVLEICKRWPTYPFLRKIAKDRNLDIKFSRR